MMMGKIQEKRVEGGEEKERACDMRTEKRKL